MERRGGRAVDRDVRYRPPYDWPALLGHLRARAIEGVEEIQGGAYRRTAAHEGQLGTVAVRHEPARRTLVVSVSFRDEGAVAAILARVRRVFDTEADVEVIGAHLSRDPLLARLLALRPGLRCPGAWDGFELAVRAVLGQQVTVAAARLLAGRLVALCGEALPGDRPHSRLSHAFPSPERLAAADLSGLGMPGARKAALRALAEAAAARPDLFHRQATLEEGVARLRALRGIGEWTAQYVALRALRETDAFPSTDVALRRSAASRAGKRPTPAALAKRAEAWRPWRAYAAQHLWTAVAEAPASPEGRPLTRGRRRPRPTRARPAR